MNEAVITFICTDLDEATYSKVVRVEFEGTPVQLLEALNAANGTMSEGDAEAFNVVAIETLYAK